MVLTITVVGANGQGNTTNNGSNDTGSSSSAASGNNGAQDAHAVVSPNDLAQYLSGQTVTGLLNPDGSITLNHSNLFSAQQMSSIPASGPHNGIATSSLPTSANFNMTTTTSSPSIGCDDGSLNSQFALNRNNKFDPQMQANSISNIQQAIASSDLGQQQTQNSALQTINNSHSQTQPSQAAQLTKKSGQKRLTAKQKQALQQQQQQLQQQQQMIQHQVQSPDTRQQQIMTPDQAIGSGAANIGQQPQVVATVQLPNGQVGQLIAPAGGGQYWSPNAINLQQLSMAVAAATGTMPQTLTMPSVGSGQAAQQSAANNQQQSVQSTVIQNPQQQQQQPQQQNVQQVTSLGNNNLNQQQVMTTVQLPNNQLAQVIGRPSQLNQIWSGGPITLQQLTSLAQQGVIQLLPFQPGSSAALATNSPIVAPNLSQMSSLPMVGGDQLATQDPNDQSKWQITSASSNSTPTTNTFTPQAPRQQTRPSTISASNARGSSTNESSSSFRNNANQFAPIDSSKNSQNNPNNSALPHQQAAASDGSGNSASHSQRKLKRLACTCPNCRDGDSGRAGGSDKKKQHICHFPDCTKVYGKTSHLRAHLRWHSGERPYVCGWSFCGKKFTRSDELQRHKRTHTGEKRFQCPECLKRFMRSDHLSKHLKTHLSTKKGATLQQQQQQQSDGQLSDERHQQQQQHFNGLMPVVSLPQSSLVKTERMNMIDEANLGSMSQDSDDRSGVHQFLV